MEMPDWVGNKTTMCVRCIIVYIFCILYVCFGLPVQVCLTACSAVAKQKHSTNYKNNVPWILFTTLFKNSQVSILTETHGGFLFDMRKKHLRFSLWACDVPVLSCSLPAVKNVFSYEIASWFEWMEWIISAVSAMGDNDELSLNVFLKILIFRAHQMVFMDLLFS